MIHTYLLQRTHDNRPYIRDLSLFSYRLKIIDIYTYRCVINATLRVEPMAMAGLNTHLSLLKVTVELFMLIILSFVEKLYV